MICLNQMATVDPFDVPYVCTLSPALLKQAEDELKEKENWRDRDIQALRDMVLAHKGFCTMLTLWLRLANRSTQQYGLIGTFG